MIMSQEMETALSLKRYIHTIESLSSCLKKRNYNRQKIWLVALPHCWFLLNIFIIMNYFEEIDLLIPHSEKGLIPWMTIIVEVLNIHIYTHKLREPAWS